MKTNNKISISINGFNIKKKEMLMVFLLKQHFTGKKYSNHKPQSKYHSLETISCGLFKFEYGE